MEELGASAQAPLAAAALAVAWPSEPSISWGTRRNGKLNSCKFVQARGRKRDVLLCCTSKVRTFSSCCKTLVPLTASLLSISTRQPQCRNIANTPDRPMCARQDGGRRVLACKLQWQLPRSQQLRHPHSERHRLNRSPCLPPQLPFF
jgi:hypothetical protein